MLEVCIDSLESAINAVHGGADELEVCSSLAEGGLTPSAGLVMRVQELVNKIASNKPMTATCPPDCYCTRRLKPKVNVMIRSRTGSDFCYSTEEMDTMLSDVQALKALDVDRFVFGALTATQHIDLDNCKKILELAKPIPCTFHRAFDVCRDPMDTFNDIINLGFDRLLTSGRRPSAGDADAIDFIKGLLKVADSRIEIMPGAGVSAGNAKVFIDIGCTIVHSSCKVRRDLPRLEFGLAMGTSDSECLYVTDEGAVKSLKNVLSGSDW